MEASIRTVKGLYKDGFIVLDSGEKIIARPYASKESEVSNKYGYFNLLKKEEFFFEIIINFLIVKDFQDSLGSE